MEENLRIRMDGILGSPETLVVQLILLGRGRALSPFSSIVRLQQSLHCFRLYGGFMLTWCFWEHISLAPCSGEYLHDI